MTRREYLTALNQYLVTMSESEKTAILKEYDDHYRRGFEAGKTEAQISASLGSPYDVATQFLEGRRPQAPTYPSATRQQTPSSSDYIGQTHRQTSSSTYTGQTRPQAAQPRPQTPSSSTYDGQTRPQAAQPRPQTPSSSTYAGQTRPQGYSAPTYPAQQQTYSEPAYTPQPQRQTYPEPAYTSQPQLQTYSEPAYTPQQQPYSAPTYPTHVDTQYGGYPQGNQAYVDYDRAAEEEPVREKKKKHESKYSTTGIIIVAVIGVILVPTLGFSVYYLVRGIYELLRAFPGTGVALIAAGGSLSANSLWICLGLIFIGISFLALTGLLVMAIIEITRLFIKLFRYVIKECKKMIKEGSF